MIPDPQENKTETAPMEWGEALKKATLTNTQLAGLNIIPRKMIIGGFCFQGDLGFIFAARGLGKTWLGMHLAKCIALGQNCGPWEIKEPEKVLYIDGEMPAADIKMRDRMLGKVDDNLSYLNHEILFERTGKILNIANPECQKCLFEFILQEGFKVVLHDNLSTLSTGMDENKGLDWEQVNPYLMQLRREHITDLFLHHAGRNNQMRGHSKREDPSAWVLRLDAPSDSDSEEGAHFISRFTKWRNASKQPTSLEWIFQPNKESGINVVVETASNMDIFRDMVESGIDSCKTIAEEMGVSKQYISKLAKKAESEGWLEINGSKYKIVTQKQRYSAAHSDP